MKPTPRTWRTPLLLSAVCTVGLVAALFLEGLGDVLATAAIAVPLVAVAVKWRASGRTSNVHQGGSRAS